jgi:PKD repeat protein
MVPLDIQSRQMVAFIDGSVGAITSRKWDFGDGKTYVEQYPDTFSKGIM